MARLADQLAGSAYVGHVVNPLDDPAAASQPDRRRTAVPRAHRPAVHHRPGGQGRPGRRVGPRASHLRPRSRSATAATPPSFNEVNDQTRKDLTNAELIAFPVLAILLLIVFRSVVAAAVPLLIGVLSIVGTLLVLRMMASLGRHLAVRAQHRHRPEPGARGRLRAAAGLAVPRGGRRRTATPSEAHRRTVRTAGRTAMFSGLTVAGGDGRPRADAAAVPLLGRRRRRRRRRALRADGGLRRPGPAGGPRAADRQARDPPRPGGLRRPPTAGSASPAPSCGARSGRRVAPPRRCSPSPLRCSAPRSPARAPRPSRPASSPTRPTPTSRRTTAARSPKACRSPSRGAVSDGDAGRPARPRIAAVDHVRAGRARSSAPTTPSPTRPLRSTTRRCRRAPRTPSATSGLWPSPTGGQLLVSGNTARFIDEKASLVDNAPLVIGLIVLLTVVLLFLLTGSVLLPLKTLLMNALTLAASLGILVIVFEKKFLVDAAGLPGPVRRRGDQPGLPLRGRPSRWPPTTPCW